MLFLVVVGLTVGMPQTLTLAVVAHEGSTLLVAANGLRLLAGAPLAPVVPTGWTSELRRGWIAYRSWLL